MSRPTNETLARYYRPEIFDDIVGQDSIVKILKRQLDSGEFKNVYLFCGSSGCGKTTAARCFATALNGTSNTAIEIDGASNNGVENVKTIVKAASQRSVDSKYKIYIIDECHSLTSAAWQAFLKCIEEPPKYTIFIFCTTDPQKIPDTILNRVMRFNFNKISPALIKERLIQISNWEQFTNYEESCDYISKICNGQMRDGIALLDKAASYSTDLCITNVMYALGHYSNDLYFELVNNIIDADIRDVLKKLSTIYNSGSDLKLFVEKFLEFCIDIEKYAVCNDISITKFPTYCQEILDTSVKIQGATSYYMYLINKLLQLKNDLKTDTNPYSTIQVIFLQMCRCQ